MSICSFKYSLTMIIILCSFFVLGQSKTVIIDDLVFKEGSYLYQDLKFNGLAFYKANTGQFIAEVSFKNGKMHGKRICYNYRGKVLSKDKFKDGKGRMKIFYSNDHLKQEGIFNNGKKEGVWSYYNQNGGLKAEECWGNNIKELIMWEKYYNKIGLLESELIYKEGVLVEERYYNDEGKVFKTNNYLNQ